MLLLAGCLQRDGRRLLLLLSRGLREKVYPLASIPTDALAARGKSKGDADHSHMSHEGPQHWLTPQPQGQCKPLLRVTSARM